MSHVLARDVVSRIQRAPLLHSEDRIDVLAANLRQLAAADAQVENEAWATRKMELVAAYGLPQVEQRKPFAYSQGRAIVPVHGTLINRFSASWGYVTGYNFIRNQVAAAMADQEVETIVLDVNSFGGMVAGAEETADMIYQAREAKRVVAIVDAAGYSAGYWLASAASRLVVTPSGGVGSIGVVATHMSMAKMLDSFGIEVTFIHAGAKKVDGNPYEPLGESARADIQREVDATYMRFVDAVAKYRKKDKDKVRATEAGTFNASEAVENGLADAVLAPQFALADENMPSDKDDMEANTHDKEGAMPGENNGAAPDPAEVQKAERARVAGIMGHANAKGREKLAQHLALNTSMSVDDAAAILAASATETTAPAAEQGSGAFKKAMDADTHPNLSADGDGKDKGTASVADRIVSNFTLATGFKLAGSEKTH